MRTGYGHMVLDHTVAKVRRMREERAERLRAITTVDEARAYQQQVRTAIEAAFSPRPPKTPLNAQVLGSLQRDTYRLEKVTIESRPGFTVTANLYVPEGLRGPAPAVLGTCGHSVNGKASDLYQGFCQRLAAAGFVSLIFDPIQQGERDQYWRLPEGKEVGLCPAHNMMGKQLELLGDSFGMWRAWDGIRALDYLLSRPEVDSARVGLTGNSGGGTATTWLWPIEERITMAAPSCFVTTFLHNLENELPADSEQYPPGVLGAGLEMADFLIARAPAPVIILGQHYDFFDRRGHQEACDEVRRFYEIMGAPEGSVACFRGPHPHGYHRENQEAMVAFFARHAGLGEPPRIEPEPEEESAILATPSGNVIAAGARPIYELIAEGADRLAQRPTLAPDALRARLAELLALPTDRSAPHHRNLRSVESGGRRCARYAVETEGDVRAILYKVMAEPAYSQTLDVGPTVHLYLPHCSSEEDLASDALALSLQAEHELYALDVRGLGESAPDEADSFWAPYGMDYLFHGHGVLFGESYLGRRVYDALRTLDLLVAEGAREVHLYGRGQGALIALFTAMLHPQVVAVTLKNGPQSYSEWAHAPLVSWPSANFLRGVLHHFDLDDCLRALGDKVTVLEPWGPGMAPA